MDYNICTVDEANGRMKARAGLTDFGCTLLSIRCVLLFIFLWMSGLYLVKPVQAAPTPSDTPPNFDQTEGVYKDATLKEDVSWRGTILVSGYLVVAPQATLRIEPGTVVRFSAGGTSRQMPRLVIMGRIVAVGAPENPIRFLQARSAGGTWGGILLLASEKRNRLEHCYIEAAQTAIDARFSGFTAKNLTVTNSTTGVLLQDSVVSMQGCAISTCETGLEVHDSELDVRDSVISENRTGMALLRSAVVISSVVLRANTQQGILSDDCRLKISSCEVVDNAAGARIRGGEGRLFMSRFTRNRDTALHITGARLTINRCRIADNLRDGMLLSDGRAVVWDNDFSGNAGYNLVSAGLENLLAVRNWWGTADESSLMAKIRIGSENKSSGALGVFPWLTEKPVALP